MVYTWQYLVYFSMDDQVAVPKVKKKRKKISFNPVTNFPYLFNPLPPKSD